ncbi:MAG: EamA family transporter [Cardiobacteriaceae bacterium]|nr:EamA family transporter [Cardiobacteriaceae bacterium]
MFLYLLLVLLMTFLGSLASLFLKRAASAKGVKAMLGNLNFYAGGFLYFVSALLNIWLLRLLNYSVVLPLTSLTYIWTMFLSYLILKETITRKKIIGVSLILLGAVMVSAR